MNCPTCENKMIVVETREKIIGTYRRYKCKTCGGKPVPTLERIVVKPLKATQ